MPMELFFILFIYMTFSVLEIVINLLILKHIQYKIFIQAYQDSGN